MSQQTVVPTFTSSIDQALAAGTPRNWTVTTDPVRKEYDGGALPVRGQFTRTVSLGTHQFTLSSVSERESRIRVGPGVPKPLSEFTILDGPYLYAYSANGSVASVRDSAGNELPIQRIAKGPQPCTRAGWLEIIRLPITAAQHDSEDFVVRVEGTRASRVVVQFEATIADSTSHAAATDARPLVFGGSRRFPDRVNLGAHRPDITRSATWINWFDLDRITGDELMLNDASNAGSYSSLGGTRVPNDAVAQDFFDDPQTSRIPSGPWGVDEGIIGWRETVGYQDCAVALGHIWMGRQ